MIMRILNPGKKRGSKRAGASIKRNKPSRFGASLSRAIVFKWLMLLALIGVGAYGAMTTPRMMETVSQQRVEQVIIEGEVKFISEREVLSAVNDYISESLLLVDMDEIKLALEAMPWIRAVTIRREWPDTLVLNIVEEKAIARWGNNKLLNQDGAIFSPEDIVGLENLAILSGPSGSEGQVMEQYLLFNQLLYQRGLKIAELILNERSAWKLILANGVVVNVGKTEVMERMRRLVGFVDPLFIEQMVAIESIDLRYASGIAVKNKSINAEEVVSL